MTISYIFLMLALIFMWSWVVRLTVDISRLEKEIEEIKMMIRRYMEDEHII